MKQLNILITFYAVALVVFAIIITAILISIAQNATQELTDAQTSTSTIPVSTKPINNWYPYNPQATEEVQ